MYEHVGGHGGEQGGSSVSVDFPARRDTSQATHGMAARVCDNQSDHTETVTTPTLTISWDGCGVAFKEGSAVAKLSVTWVGEPFLSPTQLLQIGNLR